MLRRRKSTKNNPPGEDSFLDVVANLVGILIILVVIIGAQASSSWVQQVKEDSSKNLEIAQVEKELKTATSEAFSYEREHHELLKKIQIEETLTAANQKARHKMLVELAFLKQSIEEKKENLDAIVRVDFEQESEKSRLENELQRINNTIQTVKIANEQKRETIEHFPSPVAKTVFNRELHFQLKNGRICEVPIDALIEKVKAEIRLKAEKIAASGNSTVETVGPIGDFRMQYLLQAGIADVPTPNGTLRQRTVEFKQFILIPSSQKVGTLVESALQSGSEFSRLVEQNSNTRTTFSIWVYPEDYAEFRRLKQFLMQRGIQTAVWPLPANAPISGGPDGFRSSSQ